MIRIVVAVSATPANNVQTFKSRQKLLDNTDVFSLSQIIDQVGIQCSNHNRIDYVTGGNKSKGIVFSFRRHRSYAAG